MRPRFPERVIFLNLLIVMSVVLIGFIQQVRAEHDEEKTKLRLLTESWVPVSFEEAGVAKGYSVELVNQLQFFIGTHVKPEVLPWARALSIAEATPNVLLFATSINEERKKQFDFVGPILTSRISLFARSDDALEIKSIEGISEFGAIGVYRGTIGESLLKRAGVTDLLVASFPEHSAKQLMRGRIRLWCQAELAVESLLAKINVDRSKVKPVLVIADIDLYLAFSKGTPQKVIRVWAEALTAFKASGRFALLHHEYFDDLPVSEQVDIIWRDR
ncbi:amino acid ABC transporter substrate-binding protein, PAAT family [Shewanella psychrophila]|uniref:Amino acid ABC transporter substrate-binding protein, PAAT family n=1 Tax=Shewanella psychrophila TaxID=225848 RepID=A0A1S6HVJ8_9GAMM|nr:ABC transporter substrate-binding protein [Shewanella psychrophila]AQS39519.1 amino acid ABC transporter substrate-binding protein, PAAT family [Shewanella psychrophila]